MLQSNEEITCTNDNHNGVTNEEANGGHDLKQVHVHVYVQYLSYKYIYRMVILICRSNKLTKFLWYIYTYTCSVTVIYMLWYYIGNFNEFTIFKVMCLL